MASRNPLSFLGLRKLGDSENEEDPEPKTDSPKMSKGGVELNNRGVPARKRKLNSLIYGVDDLVSIPVKSPKKRGSAVKTPTKANGALQKALGKVAKENENTEKSVTPTKATTTKADKADSETKSKSAPSSPVKISLVKTKKILSEKKVKKVKRTPAGKGK